VNALDNVQTFLHGELDDRTAADIRAHLMACESCMDDFDVEQAITALVRRCCPPEQPSPALRMRISSLSVHTVVITRTL